MPRTSMWGHETHSSLTSPTVLGTMPLYSDEPELRLGLKHELRETYVFRRGTRLVLWMEHGDQSNLFAHDE